MEVRIKGREKDKDIKTIQENTLEVLNLQKEKLRNHRNKQHIGFSCSAGQNKMQQV